ncbi:hypothetical protein D3C80_2068070 [compost metagenome]
MGIGDLRQRIEAVDRGNDVAAHFLQKGFRSSTNRFRVVDHHDPQALGMLFHVRPYYLR